MKLPRIQLYYKILLSVFVVVTVITYLSAYLSYQKGKADMEVADRQVFLRITVATAKEANKVFMIGRTLTQSIATHSDVRSFMAGNKGVSAENRILDYFRNFSIGNTFPALYLVDKDGLCILSTDESFVGHNFGFRNYFTHAIKGGAGVDAGVGVVSRRMGYYFSYPIYSLDGSTIIGVVVAKMEPKIVHEVLDNGDFGYKTNVMLTNDNGVILHSTKAERVFWSLAPLTEEQMAFEQSTRFIDRVIEPLTYPKAAHEVASYVSPVIFDFFDERDNEDETVSVAKVGDTPFYIITETESNLLSGHIFNQATQIIIFVGGGIVLAMILISILLYVYLLPLSIIRKSLLRMAVRERVNIPKIRTGDELEEINDSLQKIVNR